eukprot:TRINITY_DN2034_c3_g1_i1.p1 TRINITY_DN2034_c3_g1~~TRINITY_DN2034_c3_g1_i1.p1  ORF type:complete len:291 (+),score=55.17 TRINITY_DN2034_c3_g1_i1:60-875(+)
MSSPSLGFVGVGTINSSIIKGLCKAGCDSGFFKFPIYVSPRGEEKVAELLATYGDKIKKCENNEEVAKSADVIFLGVVPKVADPVMSEISGSVKGSDKLIVNLVATLPIATCSEAMGGVKVCKAVPLPPVAHQRGVTSVCPSNEIAKNLFELLGTVVQIETEDHQRALQAATALMGPFYAQCQALQEWLSTKGLSPDVASQFAGSFYHCISYDSANCSKTSSDAFKTLIAEQTPGGLNEQAIKELTEAGVYDSHKVSLDSILGRLTKAAQQ